MVFIFNKLSSTISTQCTVTYPQDIAYLQGSTVNIIPSTSCNVLSWTIEPSLPSYLSFDSQSGTISGKVEEVFEQRFVITAQTNQGNVQTSLILSVLSNGCEADGIWPFTYGLETAQISCADEYNYVGAYYRTCEGYFAPHWGEVYGNCSLGPPYNLQYPYKRIQSFYGYSLSPIVPSFRGKGSKFSLGSSLPSGLQFNSKNGAISGIPTGEEGCSTVRVSVLNEIGDCTTSVEVCVIEGKSRPSSQKKARPSLWNICSIGVLVVCVIILVLIAYCLRKWSVCLNNCRWYYCRSDQVLNRYY